MFVFEGLVGEGREDMPGRRGGDGEPGAIKEGGGVTENSYCFTVLMCLLQWLPPAAAGELVVAQAWVWWRRCELQTRSVGSGGSVKISGAHNYRGGCGGGGGNSEGSSVLHY